MVGGLCSREDKMGVRTSFAGGWTINKDLETSTESSGLVWTKSIDSQPPVVVDSKPHCALTWGTMRGISAMPSILHSKFQIHLLTIE